MRSRRVFAIIAVFVMFAILWIASARRHRVNPVSAIVFENRATAVNRSQVTEVHLTVDGQDVFDRVVQVQSGSEFEIAGRLQFATPTRTGHLSPRRMLIIGHRPAGSSESAWKRGDPSQEWVGPAMENFSFKGSAKIPPGDYDLRVYLLVHAVDDDLPKFDLVGSGKLRVVASTTSVSR